MKKGLASWQMHQAVPSLVPVPPDSFGQRWCSCWQSNFPPWNSYIHPVFKSNGSS